MALACAEQVGDKDFSLMPDDRGASLQLQYTCTFCVAPGYLCEATMESVPDLDLVLIIVLVLPPLVLPSADNSSFVVWSRTRWHVDRRGARSPKQSTPSLPRQSFSCPLLFSATLVTGRRPLEGERETHLVWLFHEHELNPEYASSCIIKDAPIWTAKMYLHTPLSLFNSGKFIPPVPEIILNTKEIKACTKS